ncbi:hypothetical protein RQP46_000890 [Phenoliferia psychrophenolica]
MEDGKTHLTVFEEDFMPVLEGAFHMFAGQGETGFKDEFGTVTVTDADKIYQAEQRVKETRKLCGKIADAHREDLQAISRQFELQKASSTRSSAFPSKAQHQASMNRALEDRIKRSKANNELDQQLSNGKVLLERLQQELKEEEADAFETSELNSEVLRLKMYRDLGFTPVEENGIYTKVLVRSANSLEAGTVQIDSVSHDFVWANYLWDAVSK